MGRSGGCQQLYLNRGSRHGRTTVPEGYTVAMGRERGGDSPQEHDVWLSEARFRVTLTPARGGRGREKQASADLEAMMVPSPAYGRN